MKTIHDAKHALLHLRGFIGRSQLGAVRDCLQGEESQFFIDKMCELDELIRAMPKTYEQDGAGKDAVIYLHYFIGGCDWYITEKDIEPAQHQAFGLADIGYGGELGYISIVELLQNDVELDFYFTPRTLEQLEKGEKPKTTVQPETFPVADIDQDLLDALNPNRSRI
jgi:hypothetical protein